MHNKKGRFFFFSKSIPGLFMRAKKTLRKKALAWCTIQHWKRHHICILLQNFPHLCAIENVLIVCFHWKFYFFFHLFKKRSGKKLSLSKSLKKCYIKDVQSLIAAGQIQMLQIETSSKRSLHLKYSTKY